MRLGLAGDSGVIEMLIKFLEAKLQLGHMAIAGLYSHDCQ